jgi:hypothetical protein
MSARGGASKSRRGISLPFTLAMVGLVAAVLWWRGHGFYQLGLDARVDHPDFRALRSSGRIGYFYGIVGTFLIFTNLMYLARRKMASRRLGSMKMWLDLHVFTGLTGTCFIAFHSTFQARSVPAQVTVLSLVVVVATGIVGRYLYRLAHAHTDPVKSALAHIEEALPGTREAVTAALAARPLHRLDHHASLMRVLFNIPAWRRETRGRVRAGRQVLAARQAPRSARKRLVRGLRREGRATIARSLLGSWRPMHRLFAILMILVVGVHIGVAWHYGYRWIFSQ